MTDPAVVTAETRRGRPRPEFTITLDTRVFEHLHAHGPLTKSQVAEQLDLTPSRAYLSLWRLRRDGKISRARGESGAHVWSVTEGAGDA